MIDRKGVTSFLAITFGAAYAIEAALIASGIPIGSNAPGVAYVVIAGVMWVPTLATVVTIKWITRERFAITNLRFGTLFPNVNPLLGGITGLAGMGVWLGIGLWEARRGARQGQHRAIENRLGQGGGRPQGQGAV